MIGEIWGSVRGIAYWQASGVEVFKLYFVRLTSFYENIY